jgi:hypothetical protein
MLALLLTELKRILAWRELALRFIDSYNPQPDKAIVIAHCILEWDGELGDNMRRHAHHFVERAVMFIDGPEQVETPKMDDLDKWLIRWRKDQLGY